MDDGYIYPSIRSRPTDNLLFSSSLGMYMYWGRKPEYTEQIQEAKQEHAHSIHTASDLDI